MSTYNDILSDLDAKIRNKKDTITNLRTLINSSVRAELSSFDYNSLILHTYTARAVYDDVFLYPLPSDMRKEGIIDIVKYKHLGEGSNRNWRKVPLRKFNSNFDPSTFAFDFNKRLFWLKANLSETSGTILIHNMDSLTTNGTWTATDDGTNITKNDINYVSGNASIGCDLSAGGTALSIVNSTFTALDLSDITKLFCWVYLPSTENVSNVTIRYGSDASNYKETSATVPFNIGSFQQGWNFVAFDKGTETGTVDLENIDYLKLTINFSSTPTSLTGFIFDNVLSSKGEPMEIIYYSKYGWQNSAGTWIENSTANADTLNADSEEYEVLITRIAYDAAKAVPMSTEDIQIRQNDYITAKKDYALKYPSKRKRTRIVY